MVRHVDVAEKRAARKEARSLAAAQANAWTTDWSAAPPTRPAWTGTQTVTPALSALRALIDWGPFFRTWELKGAYPALLSDPVVGEQARSLQADADAMLDRIEREGWLQARGVVGIFPANARGDDVVLWADDARASAREVLHTLRQQNAKSSGRPNLALADFVAPEGVEDWVGAFAVTAGLGIAPHVARFEADHDYRAILLKALADQLAGPSRSTCTGWCGRSCGPTRRTRRCRARSWSPSATAASAPPRATPPAPTTPRSARCGASSTWKRTPGSR